MAAAGQMTSRPATRVLAVYPSAPEVPANLLRFYLEFSAPMREDVALDHVRLIDDSGRVVQGAFLELREELWDPARRRLTLLLDPGRIKRGLRSHQELGSALVEGRTYRLIIGGAWPDATGRQLAGQSETRFRVGSADRTTPRLEAWKVFVPREGTRDPLRVRFEKPLDHALAAVLLRPVDDRGVIDGRVTLADDDQVWLFTPSLPWRPPVVLQVDPHLEDLAGNSIARAFDVDRQSERSRAETTASVERASLKDPTSGSGCERQVSEWL